MKKLMKTLIVLAMMMHGSVAVLADDEEINADPPAETDQNAENELSEEPEEITEDVSVPEKAEEPQESEQEEADPVSEEEITEAAEPHISEEEMSEEITEAVESTGLANENAFPFALESVSGFVEVKEEKYYVDAATHTLLKGQKKIDGFWYFFDPKTGAMTKGFVTLDSQNNSSGEKTVYYDKDGHMVYGLQMIDGEGYYFDIRTGAMLKGQKKIDGWWYYFSPEDGVMAKGFVALNSQNNTAGEKTVYYDKDGHMVYGLQTIAGRTYYFDPRTGGQLSGQKKIDGWWYYFDPDNGTMQTGFVELNGQNNTAGSKTVYYDKNGHMVYSLQKIDGKTYYFDPATGARLSGQKKIGGYWYYFDPETFEMTVGFVKLPDTSNSSGEKTVYYDENGHMLYGSHEIDGEMYYFNTRTGAMTKDGFRKVPGSNGNTIMVYIKEGEIVKRGFKLDQTYYQVNESTGEIIHEQKLFTNAIYMEGIDISEHNGNIDLSKYQNGFVIIRIGWWTTPDKMAFRNMDLCDKYNIPYGVYLYDYTTEPEDAVTEAKFTLEMIKGRNIRCGIWFDMEDDGWRARNGVAPDHPNISKICQKYCETIERAGYHVGIYASYSWFENYITGCDRWDKWVAHWGSNNGNWNTNLANYCPMHQYTSIPLDTNVMYVDPYHFR